MVPATLTAEVDAPRKALPPPLVEGRTTLRMLDAQADRAQVDRLLARAVPDDYLLSMLDRWLAAGGVMGGFDGDELVAIQRLDDLGEGEGWIGAIRVAPERRREGWGRRLTQWAIDVARGMGMSTVRLVIEDDNVASRALAKSNGFRSVASMSHSVGIAPAPASATGLAAAPLRPVDPRGVPDPRELRGIRAMNGLLLTTTPRPMRFVRASRERLVRMAEVGHLLVAGDDLRAGLCVVGPPGPSSRAETRVMRLFATLGEDDLGTFEAASAVYRSEGAELEGFPPIDGDRLPRLRAAGWRSGEHAFWGEQVQLYEVRT